MVAGKGEYVVKLIPKDKAPLRVVDVKNATRNGVVDLGKIKSSIENRKALHTQKIKDSLTLRNDIGNIFQKLHEEIFGFRFPMKSKGHFVTKKIGNKVIRAHHKSDKTVLYDIFINNRERYNISTEDFKEFLLYSLRSVEGSNIKSIRQLMNIIVDEAERFFVEKYKRQIGKNKVLKMQIRVAKDAELFE